MKADVITFTFVPEKILWLLPLALFLPRILNKRGFRWLRFAKITNMNELRTNKNEWRGYG